MSTGLASLTQLGNGVPKGYLRVLVFDKDSVLVDHYTRQLTAAAYQSYEPLQVQLVLPQDGCVTTYVGNESNVDVFFDDVTIAHRRGLQVQEVHYDPYGLSLAGLSQSSPGLRPLNKFTFNGVEFGDDLGLGLHLTLFRLYDPQLGRFHQVDPLADFTPDFSPFAFADGNPVANSDPDGLTADGPGPLLKVWRAVKETALAAAGFTKHGDYNAGGRGGKGNVYHTFLGHTHHSQGGGGIKPLKPRVATLDAPPLGSPPVPDMQTVPVPFFNHSTPVITHSQHKSTNKSYLNPKSVPPKFEGEEVGPQGRDFDEPIYSKFGSSQITVDSWVPVKKLASFLKTHADMQVVITSNIAQTGFTQLTYSTDIGVSRAQVMNQMVLGDNNMNVTARTLMLARAQAIANALVKLGVSRRNITTQPGGVYDALQNPSTRKTGIKLIPK